MKKKGVRYNRGKKESHGEVFKRNLHKYLEKINGNAYLRTNVWIVSIGDVGEDGITLLGYEEEGVDYKLVLAYSSKAKAEAYRKKVAAKGEKSAVNKMPLGVLAVLAMTDTVRNVAIDRLGDGSDYIMLDVIKMKARLDDGIPSDADMRFVHKSAVYIEIRQMRRTGSSFKDLARNYKITTQRISTICNRNVERNPWANELIAIEILRKHKGQPWLSGLAKLEVRRARKTLEAVLMLRPLRELGVI